MSTTIMPVTLGFGVEYHHNKNGKALWYQQHDQGNLLKFKITTIKM